MHKVLDDPIPAPADPVVAGECICICKKPTTNLNGEITAVNAADTSDHVSVDIEDPPG